MAALEKKNFAKAEWLLSLALKEAEKPNRQINPGMPHDHEFQLYNCLSALARVYCRKQKWNEAECYRFCNEPIQRIRYADNETNYCAKCQTEGKLLADRSLSRGLKSDWPRTLDELEA